MPTEGAAECPGPQVESSYFAEWDQHLSLNVYVYCLSKSVCTSVSHCPPLEKEDVTGLLPDRQWHMKGTGGSTGSVNSILYCCNKFSEDFCTGWAPRSQLGITLWNRLGHLWCHGHNCWHRYRRKGTHISQLFLLGLEYQSHISYICAQSHAKSCTLKVQVYLPNLSFQLQMGSKK